MKQLYEVIFYSGEQPLPAYYVIDQISCENIEEELKNKIVHFTQAVRKISNIGDDDISNHKIHEALYIIREDGLIPITNIG